MSIRISCEKGTKKIQIESMSLRKRIESEEKGLCKYKSIMLKFLNRFMYNKFNVYHQTE